MDALGSESRGFGWLRGWSPFGDFLIWNKLISADRGFGEQLRWAIVTETRMGWRAVWIVRLISESDESDSDMIEKASGDDNSDESESGGI